jgi:hypothetical protein
MLIFFKRGACPSHRHVARTQLTADRAVAAIRRVPQLCLNHRPSLGGAQVPAIEIQGADVATLFNFAQASPHDHKRVGNELTFGTQLFNRTRTVVPVEQDAMFVALDRDQDPAVSDVGLECAECLPVECG